MSVGAWARALAKESHLVFLFLFFFFLAFVHLFIWLHRVLAAAHRAFSLYRGIRGLWLQWVGSFFSFQL